MKLGKNKGFFSKLPPSFSLLYRQDDNLNIIFTFMYYILYATYDIYLERKKFKTWQRVGFFLDFRNVIFASSAAISRCGTCKNNIFKIKEKTYPERCSEFRLSITNQFKNSFKNES